ncbi:MAG: histidine kinase [Tannerellaceae bacterium]|nr:histidine kinase [Tannerellaceae bacterium]
MEKIIADENYQETLMNMEVLYETEKKEMRIASLEKERQLYIWLGIAGVLLTIALAIVLRQKVKNGQKEKQLIATRSVLDGEMGERTRLARDLHDRLSGNLSAVKIGLNDHSKESLQSINNKLDSCIEEIRRPILQCTLPLFRRGTTDRGKKGIHHLLLCRRTRLHPKKRRKRGDARRHRNGSTGRTIPLRRDKPVIEREKKRRGSMAYQP